MRRVLAFVTVASLGLVPAAAGHAADSGTSQVIDLSRQLGEVTSQEAAVLRDLQAIRQRRVDADAKAADLEGQISTTEAEVQSALAAISVNQQEIATTQAELTRTAQLAAYTAARMYRQAVAGTSSYLWILRAKPGDITGGNQYLSKVSDRRRQDLRRTAQLRLTLDAQEAQLEGQRAEAAAKQADLEKLRPAFQAAVAAAAAEQGKEENLLAGLRTQQADIARQLAALQAVSDSIAAMLRGRGGPPPPGGLRCTSRPVPGGIGSGFGARVSPIFGDVRVHTGADMNAGMGDPIKACNSGVVVIASWQGGYGNAIVVYHGGGMATLYGHQSRFAVSVGQQVTSGQVIGYVGSTGFSTGPHLHFEVRMEGIPVDPVPYL